jgi:hypothetical protein
MGVRALPAAGAIAVGVVALAALAVLVRADGVNGNDGLLCRESQKRGQNKLEGSVFSVGHTASMFTTGGFDCEGGTVRVCKIGGVRLLGG